MLSVAPPYNSTPCNQWRIVKGFLGKWDFIAAKSEAKYPFVQSLFCKIQLGIFVDSSKITQTELSSFFVAIFFSISSETISDIEYFKSG